MDTSSASIQPQQSSSTNQLSTTGPQIRSRITVVCAECKRLKLKCDRRAPCGSCTKRGTIERCIYSPAAAEKVDLHSLNNRLMQVEATLALVTSGQNPPAFQSTYPSAQLYNPASSSSQSQGSHHHHHHYAAPTLHNTSISLSNQDLSLWLEELDLGISLSSLFSSGESSSHQHNASLAGASGYIKLEPSPFEIELTHPRSSTLSSIAIDTDDPKTLSGNTTKSLFTSRTSSPLKRNGHLHTPSPQQYQYQSHSRLQQQQRYSAQLSLPALTIYYPVPSINPSGISASFSSSTIRVSTPPPAPPPSTSPPSSSYTFPVHTQSPQCSKPQITPALIALLPPLPTCRRFLNYAKEVFRVRPVPFEPGDGWAGFEKRCISLLSGANLGKERDRDKSKEREKKKAREAKRARHIYFSGIPALQSPHQQNDNLDDDGSGDSSFGGGRIMDGGGMGGEEEFSLAFFAVMCAVLAVGSHASASSQGPIPAENPAFFFALSQQASGVWDTHISSSRNAEEREQMDLLLASLIGVMYLNLSGSSALAVGEDEDRDKEGPNLLYSLVGKMVNAARGMGLGRDSPRRKSKTSFGDKKVVGDVSATPCREWSRYQTNEKETEMERGRWEDWKLLMWWDIMFYDLFIADSLGYQPYVSFYTLTTKLPGWASDPAPPAPPADSDNDGFDIEGEEPEYCYGHDSGRGTTMQQDDFDSRSRYRPTMNSNTNGSGATDSDEEAYFRARCRLTQLAQTIKRRMVNPECCCGYTLDLASSLESEIRHWQSDLAPSIKRMLNSGQNTLLHSQPSPPPYSSDLDGQVDKPAASLVSQIQSCELALMANLLTLRVHAPFLRAPSPAPPTSLSQSTKAASSTSQLNGYVAQLTVHAAQTILRTARSLHIALGSSPYPMPSAMPPSMLDFYPLEKIVLDSIVICANPGLSTKSFPTSSTWMFDANALMDDVISGLNLLSELRVMAEPHRKIVDALYKKLSHRGTKFLKRKYDQVGMTFESLPSSTMTANGSNNGLVGGCVVDDFIPGFDVGRYQRTGNSITQQQGKPADLSSTFSPSLSSKPMSSGGLHDYHQQNAPKHKKSDNGDLLSAISTAASARLASVAAERESEKGKEKSEKGKHAKKSHPSVGIRVRVAKDGSIIRPQRAQTTAGSGGQMQAPPLMTSSPRPNADTVFAFQQQQKQKLQAANATQLAHGITGSQNSQTSSQASSPGNIDMQEHRSRSSSSSHARPQQQIQPLDVNSQSMDLPLPFISSPDQMNIQASSRKDYGIHDTDPQHQHSRHQPFGSAHMFETQPQPLYEQSQASLDHGNGSSGTSADGMSYNQVSSPFSNGSGALSDSSSPFTTSSGHPPTPTFPPHHSAPPVFGPPPTSTSSSATFFHGSDSFNASYATNSPTHSSSLATHQQHGGSSGLSLMDMGMDPAMMTPVLETPVFDKSQQQHAMFDPKSSVMDNMSRHHQQQQHQQHFQHPSYDDGSQNHRHIVPVEPPWPSPPAPHQQHQSSMSTQNNQPFWNNGEGFKFYS